MLAPATVNPSSHSLCKNQVSYQSVYAKYCALQEESRRSKARVFTRTIDLYCNSESVKTSSLGVGREPTGFERLDLCRKALEALDRRGWDRSFHQVLRFFRV